VLVRIRTTVLFGLFTLEIGAERTEPEKREEDVDEAKELQTTVAVESVLTAQRSASPGTTQTEAEVEVKAGDAIIGKIDIYGYMIPASSRTRATVAPDAPADTTAKETVVAKFARLRALHPLPKDTEFAKITFHNYDEFPEDPRIYVDISFLYDEPGDCKYESFIENPVSADSDPQMWMYPADQS